MPSCFTECNVGSKVQSISAFSWQSSRNGPCASLRPRISSAASCRMKTRRSAVTPPCDGQSPTPPHPPNGAVDPSRFSLRSGSRLPGPGDGCHRKGLNSTLSHETQSSKHLCDTSMDRLLKISRDSCSSSSVFHRSMSSEAAQSSRRVRRMFSPNTLSMKNSTSSVSIASLIRFLQGESLVGNVYFVKLLMEYPGPHICTAISWIGKLQPYNTIFCATFDQPRSIDTSRRLNASQCAFAFINAYDEKTSLSPTLGTLYYVLLPSELTRIQAWQLVCFTT